MLLSLPLFSKPLFCIFGEEKENKLSCEGKVKLWKSWHIFFSSPTSSCQHLEGGMAGRRMDRQTFTRSLFLLSASPSRSVIIFFTSWRGKGQRSQISTGMKKNKKKTRCCQKKDTSRTASGLVSHFYMFFLLNTFFWSTLSLLACALPARFPSHRLTESQEESVLPPPPPPSPSPPPTPLADPLSHAPLSHTHTHTTSKPLNPARQVPSITWHTSDKVTCLKSCDNFLLFLTQAFKMLIKHANVMHVRGKTKTKTKLTGECSQDGLVSLRSKQLNWVMTVTNLPRRMSGRAGGKTENNTYFAEVCTWYLNSAPEKHLWGFLFHNVCLWSTFF